MPTRGIIEILGKHGRRPVKAPLSEDVAQGMAQVPVQLGIRASGEVRSVKFVASEAMPAPLAICLRERLVHWRFEDVQLSSDIHLFATFALR